jgi:hypothetical protein
MAKNQLKKQFRTTPDVFAVNTPTAAKFIGCSEALLRKLRALGNGPSFSKVGSKIVYPIYELKKYIKSNLV